MTNSDTFFNLARQAFNLAQDVYGQDYELGEFFNALSSYLENGTTSSEGYVKAVYDMVAQLKET